MIEKLSGRVAYAVMSFGGFLGIGSEEHTIPLPTSPTAEFFLDAGATNLN
jgi:hypothetical protein